MNQVISHGSIEALEKPKRFCHRWLLSVRGIDPATGEPTERVQVFHGTKGQAKRALERLINEGFEKGPNSRTEITFQAYAHEWLEMRKLSGEISKGTQRKNATDLRRLMPYVGHIPVRSLDVETITRALINVKNHGGKGGRSLSGTSMNGVYRILYMVLESARKAKIIDENPCQEVKAPKKDTKERQPLPLSEARRLTGLLMEGDPLPKTIGFLLALTCGLRREEICGLCWRDFDPTARCIRVLHAFPEDERKIVEPKTKSSKRIIPLADDLLSRLLTWKERQRYELDEAGIMQTADTPVVNTSTGGHMHPQNLARAWLRYRRRHGFEGFTLHQLRHTFATRLVAQGVDMKTASTLMGHSSVAMIEQVYAHFVPENAQRAIEVLGNDLFGEGESVPVPFTDMG